MHHIKIDSKLLDSACMERTTKSRSRMLQTNTHRSSPSSRKEGRGIRSGHGTLPFVQPQR
eukprot:scaffold177_cov334-Pavlova_lutheri.AAC.95